MGMGQNINTFTPYIMPQTTYGMMPFRTMPGSGVFPFGNGTVKTETAEETEERRKKEEAKKAEAEFLKRLETIKQNAEQAKKLHAQINELEQEKKGLNLTVQQGKNGKETEDGTIKVKETWADYNKLPTWKKALRGASHIVQGTWKLATGFFGYETNPKTGESEWNWKKCLKNTAIAAGCIALSAIPYVGPVVTTTLLTTGVVCGTIGTGKGVYKAINAKTPEELDNAYQDIGAGLTIGVSSAVGLRGLGKGLQASSTATGNVVRSTSNNAVSQFVKDATINVWKATSQGIKNDASSVAANGFGKTFASNLKGTIPKLGESKFENARYETTQSINARLNQINQELNNPAISPIKKSILSEERVFLEAQKTELRNVVTKDGWKLLKNNSESQKNVRTLQGTLTEMKANGNASINGNTYTMNKDNLTALQEALSRSEKLSKEIQNLVKVRTSTMKKMAFLKKYKSDVEAYTGVSRNSRFGRIYDTAKISKSDITTKKVILSPLKALWELTMIPFKPWNYVQSTPASTFYKIEETFAPMYEAGFLTTGFIGDAMDMGDKTLKTKAVTKDENGNEKEEVIEVTKETLAQMEEQIKQYDEAIAKVQNELNQMYLG